MKEKVKTFHWRGWTTFVVTISFIVDTLSGIILYIAPHGNVANWSGWKLWWLTKAQWSAVHTIFGYVLLFIVALHLYYNWKLFVSFIWSKAKKVLNLKLELALSILVCIVIFLGSIWSIPPFSTTMDIGDHFKAGWEESTLISPVREAELLSLEDFAGTINVPLEQIMEILESRGYVVQGPAQTIEDIAKANNISPNNLYEEIKAGGAQPSLPGRGAGGGRGKL